MSSLFFDSSALAKRYVTESGSNWVRSHTAPSSGNTIFVAQITQIEIVSAVTRRSHHGGISIRTAQALRTVLERHIAHEYNTVGLTDNILMRAKDLLEAYPLRAYDTVQLASALEANSRLTVAGQPSLIFVSADTRLLSVAHSEDLTTDDPNLYP